MHSTTLKSFALVLAGVTATAASATHFDATDTVTANTGSGLIIHATPSPLHFDLNAGSSTTQTVFTISTPESSIEADDLIGKPISVAFDFTSPSNVNGTVGGTTVGQETPLIGIFQNGYVHWNGSQTFNFGSAGLLTVTLNDQSFGSGFFGLTNGGTAVSGNFRLTAAAVPEPASWAMMVGGFGVVGGALRRRSTKVSFA
jgi:hypothetical protein